MRAALRLCLIGLVAGLFGLVSFAVPALHLRATADWEATAQAKPDGAMHEHRGDPGAPDHDRHLAAQHCLACVLIVAPGLLPALVLAPMDRPVVASLAAVAPAAQLSTFDWMPQRARAPPLPLHG